MENYYLVKQKAVGAVVKHEKVQSCSLYNILWELSSREDSKEELAIWSRGIQLRNLGACQGDDQTMPLSHQLLSKYI